MLKLLLLLVVFISFFEGLAQSHIQTDTLTGNDTNKTSVKLLASDSLSSTFFIVIPNEVKLHYHAFHTENVMVINGSGVMKLGEKEFVIKKGDLIVIPKGTKHSVKSIGNKPLKVISIQSPHFDGSDRIKSE